MTTMLAFAIVYFTLHIVSLAAAIAVFWVHIPKYLSRRTFGILLICIISALLICYHGLLIAEGILDTYIFPAANMQVPATADIDPSNLVRFAFINVLAMDVIMTAFFINMNIVIGIMPSTTVSAPAWLVRAVRPVYYYVFLSLTPVVLVFSVVPREVAPYASLFLTIEYAAGGLTCLLFSGFLINVLVTVLRKRPEDYGTNIATETAKNHPQHHIGDSKPQIRNNNNNNNNKHNNHQHNNHHQRNNNTVTTVGSTSQAPRAHRDLTFAIVKCICVQVPLSALTIFTAALRLPGLLAHFQTYAVTPGSVRADQGDIYLYFGLAGMLAAILYLPWRIGDGRGAAMNSTRAAVAGVPMTPAPPPTTDATAAPLTPTVVSPISVEQHPEITNDLAEEDVGAERATDNAAVPPPPVEASASFVIQVLPTPDSN